MDYVSIIQLVEQQGAKLMLEGQHIRIKGGKSLPAALIEAIKANKPKILDILEKDKLAKEKGFVVGIPGEIYFATVKRSFDYEMTVYMEQQGTSWLVWRETHTKGKPAATKDIYEGTSFTKALAKAIRYIQAVRH